jgi:CheY-like chemotaxis protein
VKTTRGAEHLLVVDDEDMVLRVQQRLLQTLGYTVIIASSGAEALKAFESQRESIDLVVTDQAMPGMTGTELLVALRKLDATIPVVLTSGFSDEVAPKTVLDLGFAAFVSKPNLNELGQTVRRILDLRRTRQSD